MFIDVAKYLLTIIAVGALVAEKINPRMILTGLVGSFIFGVLGFWTIPPDDDEEEK